MHQLEVVRTPTRTDWRKSLSSAYNDLGKLLADLHLDPATMKLPRSILDGFPLRVPRGFVRRMRRGDPHDPLLLQVLASSREQTDAVGYDPDPVGDLDAIQGDGILRKYAGRALVVTTGACAVHCRYCFRRAFPYQDAALSNSGIERLINHLATAKDVAEVILSGGDPLTLTDEKLARLLDGIERIEHVERIRIHTRVPIVLPERVDDSLVEVLSGIEKPLVTVLHCNHANEIDVSVSHAAEKLSRVCRELLNQSVLLAGVNDSVDALVDLSEALFRAGIMPYYIHQLDRVTGAAHFEVDDSRARKLIGDVASRLPGYLVPRLAREEIGSPAKTLLAPTLP